MSCTHLTVVFFGRTQLSLWAAAFQVFFSILPVSIFSNDSAVLPAWAAADWRARFVRCLQDTTLSTVASIVEESYLKELKGGEKGNVVQTFVPRLTLSDKASAKDWQERLQFRVNVRII